MEKRQKKTEESESNIDEIIESKEERKIVTPGEVIETGSDFLPGEGTRRDGKDIVSIKFGLLDKSDKLIKVIPLSGAYFPRIGNIVIGQVYDLNFAGWFVDISAPYTSFLPVMEYGRYVNKEDLSETFNFGEIIVAKIKSVKPRGIDLTMRDHGLRKLEGGMLIKVNPTRVPRIIGKAGSMVNLIKQETGTNIVVGQNGIIWIKADDVEQEILAKKAIELITEKPFITGLTEEVKAFLEKNKGNLKIKPNPTTETY